MHNNFYFLRQITHVLEPRISGAVLSECFSQSKDELVLRFETKTTPFLMRASLLPTLGCISFPENFQRARKNSVDLFADIIGRPVENVRQFRNERSFAIAFADGYHLLFKMHGNRTNLVLFHRGAVQVLFRNNITADFALSLDFLDREIDWGRAYFDNNLDNLKAAYFTFGKIIWRYLGGQGFTAMTPEEKWESIRSVVARLEHPSYYVVMLDGKPTLSLLPVGEVLETFGHPFDAANAYYHTFTHLYAFSKEKMALLSDLRSQLVAGQNYIAKNTARRAELQDDSHYKVWGDLVMANLHNIPPGSEVVTLENFYDDNRPVQVRLRKDASPQKVAENFYRKAKNQHIEISRLDEAILQKREELETVEKKIHEVESVTELKSLRTLRQKMDPEGNRKAEAGQLPYHEFRFRDFRIWVGKNAKANDILTFRLGYKDDLWLHAKDVSGSHVLIRHQAGKNFPKDVIEYAASLAAYNSKRRNESLCPVIVTPKKFVRKRKGDPPGAVVVEREEVIMVVPARIS